MIPPSYLFRQVYRDHFEEVEPATDDAPQKGGRPAIDLFTAAVLAFSSGMAQFALSPVQELRHDRRR